MEDIIEPRNVTLLALITVLAVMISGNRPFSLGQLLQYGSKKDITLSSTQRTEKQSQRKKLLQDTQIVPKAKSSSNKVTMFFKVVSLLLLFYMSKLVLSENSYSM